MRAVAYVNHGRWVANCPRCPAAEHAGPDPIGGHVGGLRGDRFACAACGLVCAVDWPPNVDDIWRVLSARPDPATRNWAPPETAHDLYAENLAHGLTPANVLDHPGGLLLALVGDRIVAGRESLPALPLPAIGGR